MLVGAAVVAALAVVVVLLVVRARTGPARSGTTAPRRHVAARGLSYAPAEVRLPAGGAVVFTNRDSGNHTFTADDGLFDSGVVAPDGSFTWFSASPRTVSFHCEIHPGMRGTVVVTAG